MCYYVDDVRNYCLETMSDEERKKHKDGPPLKWVQFLPDACVGKVKEPYKAGLFSFRLQIHDTTVDPAFDFKQFKCWKKPQSKRMQPVKIRAYIYLCRDLPPADENGTSDSYISIWDTQSDEKQTKVIEENLNPLFYEVFDLDYEVENMYDLESYPPFIFDIWDKDSGILDSTPDFMGRAIIEPEDCAIVTQEMLEKFGGNELQVPIKPRWHPFFFGPGEEQCGEVLVRFALVEHDYQFDFSLPPIKKEKEAIPKRPVIDL